MQVAILFDGQHAHFPTGDDLSSWAVTASFEQLSADLRKAQTRLSSLTIDDIIGLCDAAGQALAAHHQAGEWFTGAAKSEFISAWLRRRNLERVCNEALHGDRSVMDRFVPLFPGAKRLRAAHPRGIVAHWLAGNVPFLGIISVIQGLLSKNANLIKVPRQNADTLLHFLHLLSRVSWRRSSGDELKGSLLSESIRAIFIPRDDLAAARALSMLVDVRVAWGGREAVEAIMNLPRRFGTEDIIFGPKTSLVVVGAEMLMRETDALAIAQRLALDTVALDQRGCNSPHTIFVETGGAIEPAGFAALLGDELRKLCDRLPPPPLTPAESFNLFSLRAEYDLRGEAWYGKGLRWTVLYSGEDQGLATPAYGRTLFVRPVSDVRNVASLCSSHVQTVAVALQDRRLTVADALTARGVARCVEPGRMSQYDTPWDGVYPIERLVRWVSA